MADIDLKTETPDTSLPSTGFLFGADSQSAASPSVYSTQTVATTLLGSTTLTGATVTADAPVLNLAQTWNNAAITFTGAKLNITDTASNAASLLMDLQVGGSSRFRVGKTGVAISYLNGTDYSYNDPARGFYGYLNALGRSTHLIFDDGSNNGTGQGLLTGANGSIRWQSTNRTDSGSTDTILTRRGTANLRLGAADAAAPVAQTLSVQSVVAGTTNTAGANLTITGSQGTGTGAGGSIVFQVAPAGSSGTAQNALATALTITSGRELTFGDPATSATAVGRINFASGDGSYRPYIGVNTSYGGLGLRVGSAGAENGLFDFDVGNGIFAISKGYLRIGDDVILRRDAANTLALRNGSSPQTFRVYNTTDGTNGNWLELAGGAFSGIYPRVAGTGTNSGLILAGSATGNSSPLYLRFQYNQNGWRIDTSGNFLAETDNAYDIGASGANRPRRIYIGTEAYLNRAEVASAQYYAFASRAVLRSPADGVLSVNDWNNTGAARINIGGDTSSFPALKRSSTTLQARLADDSAFASVQGKLTTDTAYAAGDPTTTGYLVVYDSTGTAYKIPAVAV